MLVPERAFELQRPIDTAGGMFQLFQRSVTTQGAQVALAITIPIPSGRILVISNVVLTMTAGAAQLSETMSFGYHIEGDTAGINFNLLIAPDQGLGTAIQLRASRSVECWIPPEAESMDLQAIFDAGAAVNGASLSILGITIPKANIQSA